MKLRYMKDGWSIWEYLFIRKKVLGDIIVSFKYLKVCYSKEGLYLFSKVLG